MKRIIFFFTLWITIYNFSWAQGTVNPIQVKDDMPNYATSISAASSNQADMSISSSSSPSRGVKVQNKKACLPNGSWGFNVVDIQNATCNHPNDPVVCDGSVRVDFTGAFTGPLNYWWANGQTTQTATNLCPGVTDTIFMEDVGANCTYRVFFTNGVPLKGNRIRGVNSNINYTLWTNYEHCAYGCQSNVSGDFWSCEGGCVRQWININSATGGAGGPYDLKWGPGLTYTDTGDYVPGSGDYSNTFQICDLVANTPIPIELFDYGSCVLTTSSHVINVRAQPSLTATPSPSALLCEGDCNGSISTVATPGNGGPLDYFWTPNLGNIPNPSNLCAGKYDITVRDTSLCLASDSATITEPTALQLTMNSTPENCVNSCDGEAEAFATGGTPPYTYDWGSGPTADSTINTLCAGPTTVTVTDNNNCTKQGTVTLVPPSPIIAEAGNDQQICEGSSAQLNASGGSTYSWTPTTGLSNPNIANPVASPSVTTKYFVTVGAAGCQETDSVTITTIPQPTITIAPSTDTTLCDNISIQLLASGGASYTWTPSTGLNNATIPNPVATPTSNITYTVTGVGANGCTNIDTLHITLIPAPTPTITSDTSVCIGSNMQLLASGGVNYLWSPTSGLNNPNIANPVASPLTTTTYTATVTAANGCQETASVLLTVNPLPISTMSDSVFICDTNGTMLSANGGISYLWSPSGTLSDPNIANPIATPSVTTTYYVIVTDNNGCSITDTVVAKIDTTGAGGDVNFTYSPMAKCEGIDITFTNTSLNPGTDAFTWNFGDGTSSTELSPTHLYLFGSAVTVTLTRETQGGGCAGSNSISFNLGDFNNFVNLNPPNVFSPNDDGLNDFFTLDLDGDFKDCFELEIYNRWGATVYKNNNGNKWDGKLSSGKDVPQGTYFYILKIGDATIARSLTLLR